MLLTVTRYDKEVANLFLRSMTLFFRAMPELSKHPLVIISDDALPIKTIVKLNTLASSVVVLKPKLFISERMQKRANLSKLVAIETIVSYQRYDRVYIDPLIFVKSGFQIPEDQSLFFKQYNGLLSMKLVYLKAETFLGNAIELFKKNQTLSTLTDMEFSHIVSSNYLIKRKLYQSSIINGNALHLSSITNVNLNNSIGLDLSEIFDNSPKVNSIINSIEKEKSPILMSRIINKRNQSNSIFFTSLAEIDKSIVSEKSKMKEPVVPLVKAPLKCIISRPNEFNPFEAVKKMVESKFSKLSEHDNTLVILGYNVGFNITEYRKQYPGWKIVIYQLEQVFNNMSFWYNMNSQHPGIIDRTKQAKRTLMECDEIWDYDQDNIEFLKSEGFTNIKHLPLFYSDAVIREKKITRKEYDILFYGSMNDRRAEFLSALVGRYKILILAPSQDCVKYSNHNFGKYMRDCVFGESLFNLVFKSKIVLNVHYYESILQEQVRIFELLANGVCVISEKSRRNYFGSLVKEFSTPDEMIKLLDEELKNDKWFDSNRTNKFKNFSERPPVKIGAAYNTFYGFDLIDRSLGSIRDTVDYIVLIHQRTGINGTTEEPKTAVKIKNLLKTGKIDEVIYHDPPSAKFNMQTYILEKRNLGLEACRKNGCDFIMPMDADEAYNMPDLLVEIEKMRDELIDTLYSPIRSYYYDEFHWFPDTYYVPSVIRIDHRKFELSKSSVLADPVRKMQESTYRVTTVPMHHYTYLKDSFINKIHKNVASTEPFIKNSMQKIQDYILEWKDGDSALVFANDLTKNGAVGLAQVELNKITKTNNEKKSLRNRFIHRNR